MTYIEWKQELSNHLINLSAKEREKVFAYYAEMYADKRDAGISEKDIIIGFGAPYDVAKRILNENNDENLNNSSNLNDIQIKNNNSYGNPYSKNRTYSNGLNTKTTPSSNKKSKKRGSAGKIVAIVLLAILGGLILISAIHTVIAFIYAPEFEVKEYKTINEVTKIEIDGMPGDIKTEFYEGNELIIIYPYDANYGYEISENGGVLNLGYNDEINWFWFWEIPETVIKIPNGVVLEIVAEIDAGSFSLASGEYKNVELDLDAGEIFIGDISCWALNCSVDAGEIEAGDISCTNAIFDVDAGEIFVGDISCWTLNCSVDAGEIEAGEIICTLANVDVDAGGVEIENLDCDTLEIEVDAGGAKIKTATVNHINASVNAGSIEIDMTGVAEEYSVLKEVSAGSCNLSSQQGTTDKTITVDVNAGSVTIRFPIRQAEKVNSFGDLH